MAEKRKPAAERQREHAGSKPLPSGAGPAITGRIPDVRAGPERELTRAR
jgi:hypothetical protein